MDLVIDKNLMCDVCGASVMHNGGSLDGGGILTLKCSNPKCLRNKVVSKIESDNLPEWIIVVED